MPVQGFPDRDRHRVCVRCGRWFEPGEGVRVDPPSYRAAVTLVRFVKRVSSGEPPRYFMCDGCWNQRMLRRRLAWAGLAVLALIVLLINWIVLARVG